MKRWRPGSCEREPGCYVRARMSRLEREVADRLAGLASAGLERHLDVVDGPGTHVRGDDGRGLLSFCSNDYLGFSRHPELVAAARAAAVAHGVGAGASRLVSGSLGVHREAERALAALVRQPAALLFSSTYAANVGLLPALFGPDDLLISDALNHASLIDGCRATGARVVVTPHQDASAVRRALQDRGRYGRAAIVSETLFSMDGDVADVAALASLAAEHDAAVIFDEAHAVGVLGPSGAGAAAAAGISPDVLVGGLGKALGSAGGFVAAAPSIVAWLSNRARSFVFSTAVTPLQAAVAARAAALAVEADSARETLRQHAVRLREGLRAGGVMVPLGSTPIVPLLLGSPERAMAASGRLRERGFFIQAIRPPTVPDGTSRLRVVVSAAHSAPEVDALVAALLDVL